MKGYKTYLCALLLAALSFCHYLGWVDKTVYETLSGLLLAGGLGALRAGVKKDAGGI